MSTSGPVYFLPADKTNKIEINVTILKENSLKKNRCDKFVIVFK